jgi:hypothetical protein
MARNLLALWSLQGGQDKQRLSIEFLFAFRFVERRQGIHSFGFKKSDAVYFLQNSTILMTKVLLLLIYPRSAAGQIS